MVLFIKGRSATSVELNSSLAVALEENNHNTRLSTRSTFDKVHRGISLAPGASFGASYARFARLCFTATPLEDLRMAPFHERRIEERADDQRRVTRVPLR